MRSPPHHTTTLLHFLNQTSPPGASKWFLEPFWEACQARCLSGFQAAPTAFIGDKPLPPPPSRP